VDDTRSPRWLVWAGPAFAVVFIALVFLVEGDTPGEKSTGAQVVSYYDGHQGRTMISVFASPLAALLLVLFAAAVRGRAGRSGLAGAAAATMLGGAVLWAAGLLTGSMLELGLASSADHHQAGVAQTLNVLNSASWLPFIAGIAVFLVGAGLTVLATRVVPVWLGWVAIAAGVISLAGPGGFVGFFVGPLWMLVAGTMLALRRDEVAPVARHEEIAVVRS
jgi:hypothetical protein